MKSFLIVFLSLFFFGFVILFVSVAIIEYNEEQATCYPFVRVTGFWHGKHKFAVCAFDSGPAVKLIK